MVSPIENTRRTYGTQGCHTLDVCKTFTDLELAPGVIVYIFPYFYTFHSTLTYVHVGLIHQMNQMLLEGQDFDNLNASAFWSCTLEEMAILCHYKLYYHQAHVKSSVSHPPESIIVHIALIPLLPQSTSGH